MISKALFIALSIASVLITSNAVPTNLEKVSRQEGFEFAAPTDATATAGFNTEPVIVTGSPDMNPAPMEPEPMASDEATAPDTDVPEIAYNIGGGAFGKFEADPIDWIIGETAAFELPEATIGGAEPENEDAYKSHRYGLLGSTWGYDLAIETPGKYTCSLHYAETYSEFFTAEPNRTFIVQVSGDAAPTEIQEEEFDVMVELAGAEFTAYTRTFTGIAVQTTLSIRETPVTGDAFLSGITCIYEGALE